MKMITKRIITILVATFVLIGSIFDVLSVHVFGGNDFCDSLVNSETKETTIRELNLRRDKNVKQYYLGNGDVQMISFGKSIHRKNSDGEWIDINNTLEMIVDENGKSLFSTKDGWASFPTDTLECAMVSLKNNEYRIEMSFANEGFNTEIYAEIDNPEFSNTTNQFGNVEDAIEYYNSVLSRSTVTYKNIFSDTDLEFVLSDNDLKSNIIISSADVTNTYIFKLEIEGLNLLTSEDGKVLLIDEITGECVYEITSPYMFDAKGEVSVNITQTIVESEDDTYLLVIEVDNEWINDPERSFPITIDPYLSEASSYDTYINSSSPSHNYGENTMLNISNACVSYFMHNFISIPEDSVITQAYFYVAYYYDSSVTSGTINVGLYQVMQDWGEYTWTWNLANQYTNLGLSTSAISSKSWNGNSGAYESTPVWETFMVTNLVNSWFNGTDNYGLAIKRTGGTNSEVHIKSFESGSTYRPYYVVLYKEPIITEGVYYIKSKSSNLYLETDNGYYSSGTLIKQKAKVNGDVKQLYKITYIDTYNNDKYYDIRPMTNNGLGLYAPYISSSNHDVKVNTMSTSDGWYDISQNQKWVIQTHATFGYVTLHNALNNNGGYLSSPNNSSGSTLVTTSTYGSNCRWVLEPYTGGSLSNVVITHFAPTIAVGDCIDYDAIMYDSQIGVNGPVVYGVVNTDYTTTNKATIDSTTGQMTALQTGSVKIRANYGNSVYWYFDVVIIPTYGCRDCYRIDDQYDASFINCLGYAIDYGLGNATEDTLLELSPFEWFDDGADYWHSLFQANQVHDSNDCLAVFKPILEDKLDEFLGEDNWVDVTNNGGINTYLNDNQWLVVMRIGYYDNSGEWDMHFWYRTDTGEWVNKHGTGSEEERLGEDLPTDDDSAGWKLYNFQFYNSDLVYYAITCPLSGE